MDRCKDYFGFVTWFAGIGYALLWPLMANGRSDHPFGASIFCGDAGVVAALCDLPHPLVLPVGLHILGCAAALIVALRIWVRLLRRWRTRPAVFPAAELAIRLPGAIPARSRPPVPRRRIVAPRKHFGLRGGPR